MNIEIRHLNEMTDSREMLESKVPPVIPICLIGFFVILCAVFLWSWFGEIEYTVQANGIVRPNTNISHVKNNITGRIKQLYYEHGETVEAGDLLYVLENEDQINERNVLLDRLQDIENDIENLKAYRNMITQDTNHNESELDWNPEHLLTHKEPSQLRLMLELETTQKSLLKAREDLQFLLLLQTSIQQNQNMLPDKNPYYYQYEDYMIKKDKLEKQLEIAEDDYKSQVWNGIDANEAKQSLDQMKLELDDHINQFWLQLSQSIKEMEERIETLEQERRSSYLQINEALQSLEDEKEEYLNRLTALDIQMKNMEVRASISGVIHESIKLNKGDLLQAGTEVLTIIPENNSEYVVEMAVLNRDIANISVGDPIKFRFAALPFQEYGSLQGTVRYISPDVTVNQQTGEYTYMVEATIDNKPLYSYKGEQSQIKIGMIAEAHIITRNKKIFYYILEKVI